jgi:hypothetical protein
LPDFPNHYDGKVTGGTLLNIDIYHISIVKLIAEGEQVDELLLETS